MKLRVKRWPKWLTKLDCVDMLREVMSLPHYLVRSRLCNYLGKPIIDDLNTNPGNNRYNGIFYFLIIIILQTVGYRPVAYGKVR
jgi:hypothetical protein